MGVVELAGRNLCSVVIGGDIFPGYFEEQFIRGNVAEIFQDTLEVLRTADLVVANLECPLTDRGEPIAKVGPHFKAHPDCVRGLTAAGINAVTLANNHIRDYGGEGVEKTIAALNEAGIRSFGAGHGINEANQIAIFNYSGLRVGLIGMAEHEFSIADTDTWGANPIDLIYYVELMAGLRNSTPSLDHVIVLLHAGNEYYHYPSPWLQRICRFLVDQGATAVICQHSHVAGTYEWYNKGLIVYGQGNFVYGRSSERHGRDGFLVKLDLKKNGSLDKVEFIPYVQTDIGIRRMTKDEESDFHREITGRNKALESPEALDRLWHDFVLSRQYQMLSGLTGTSRLLRRIIRRLGLTRWWHQRYDAGRSLNLVQCESHREALITLLEYMFHERTGSTD